MKDENYTTVIEINGPIEQIFSKISDITKWWSKDFEGHCKSLDEEFIIHHPGQHFSKQKVIESIPYNSLQLLSFPGKP